MHRNQKIDPVAEEVGETVETLFWGSTSDSNIRKALQQYSGVELR
jgi:hypothetical protein